MSFESRYFALLTPSLKDHFRAENVVPFVVLALVKNSVLIRQLSFSLSFLLLSALTPIDSTASDLTARRDCDCCEAEKNTSTETTGGLDEAWRLSDRSRESKAAMENCKRELADERR